MADPRRVLLDDVLAAGREHSDAVVLFHQAVAAQLDLSAVETKTLGLLEQHGPLTPGNIARALHLAPASVTALLTRLERRRLIKRQPDPSDGRRQIIELDQLDVPAVARMFDDLMHGLGELHADYSDAELRLIAQWLRAAATVQRDATPTAPRGSPKSR